MNKNLLSMRISKDKNFETDEDLNRKQLKIDESGTKLIDGLQSRLE